MTRDFLERRNNDLIRDLSVLLQMVNNAQITGELRSYRAKILQHCESLKRSASLNLAYLKLAQPTILKDVLSRTQLITQEVRLLSSLRVIPILRSTARDRLCLNTISWLHNTHTETSNYPPAVISSNCAIRPFLDIAPIYMFPELEMSSLLYQPLLFHEFGHLLYRCHEQEMDALIRDLLYAVDELLTPASQRNDRFAEHQTSQRQEIADTWYAWIQELFCDAVGFTIGGPSFLYAFSHFLGIRDIGNYYREVDVLRYSSHPVTWLRIRFLARRLQAAGFDDIAKPVQAEWQKVARMMGISEDYHGFYDESLDAMIDRTIEDMLTETSPRQFLSEEANGQDWNPKADSLIRLFNCAWHVFTKDFAYYRKWEDKQIKQLGF